MALFRVRATRAWIAPVSLCVVLACPAAAGADSLAFLSGGNVYRAGTDGKRVKKITRNGSRSNPYSGVAQDSKGRMVASRFVRADCKQTAIGGLPGLSISCSGPERVQRFSRSGKRAGKAWDPNPCQDPMTKLDVSPNGKYIAFETGVGGPCGLETEAVVLARATGSHKRLALFTGCKQPTWVDNSRVVASCKFDIGTISTGGRGVGWLNNGSFGQSPGHPAVSVARDRLAWSPLGFDGRYLRVVGISGGPPGGTVRAGGCDTDAVSRIGRISWAPSGGALAFEDGVNLIRVTRFGARRGSPACGAMRTRTVLRGGSPDWSGANP